MRVVVVCAYLFWAVLIGGMFVGFLMDIVHNVQEGTMTNGMVFAIVIVMGAFVILGAAAVLRYARSVRQHERLQRPAVRFAKRQSGRLLPGRPPRS